MRYIEILGEAGVHGTMKGYIWEEQERFVSLLVFLLGVAS